MEDRDTERLLLEAAEYIRNRRFGKYRGLVTQVGDGEHLGKVRAQVPEIYGQEGDSPWALPSVPSAGKDHGLVVLPEEGDGVWIEFEAGDISRPIWTGCWWGDDEMPEPAGVQQRAIVTTSGHKIVLDEEENIMQLRHPGGAEITMTDRDITIKIGSTQIVLSSSGVNINNGAFEVR